MLFSAWSENQPQLKIPAQRSLGQANRQWILGCFSDVRELAKWRCFVHTQITDCENMTQAKLNADPICIQNTCDQKIMPWEMGLKFMVWKAIMCFSSNFIFTYFPYFLPKENFAKVTVFNIGIITFDSSSIVLYSFDPSWASRMELLMTSFFIFFYFIFFLN